MILDADRGTQPTARHTLLGGCVLLSLLLHAALLARWPTPAHHAAAEAASSMTVVLAPQRSAGTGNKLGADSNSTPAEKFDSTQDPINPNPTTRQKNTSRTPIKKPEIKLGSDSYFIPAEKIDSAPGAIIPNPSAEQKNSSLTPIREARAAVAARVGLELARHFHYPSLAVRRGWQGIVLLGFRVGIDGDIEAVHIAQSSGHALLDRAALGALGKVHKVALEHGPLRAALDLQLPVVYRLEES